VTLAMMGLVHTIGATSWFDSATNMANSASNTGKVIAIAGAIGSIVIAFIIKRTLGAVFAAAIVAGFVLWGVNNTQNLQDKTTTDVGMRAPVVQIAPPLGA
jgi:hypothetical protein